MSHLSAEYEMQEIAESYQEEVERLEGENPKADWETLDQLASDSVTAELMVRFSLTRKEAREYLQTSIDEFI